MRAHQRYGDYTLKWLPFSVTPFSENWLILRPARGTCTSILSFLSTWSGMNDLSATASSERITVVVIPQPRPRVPMTLLQQIRWFLTELVCLGPTESDKRDQLRTLKDEFAASWL